MNEDKKKKQSDFQFLLNFFCVIGVTMIAGVNSFYGFIITVQNLNIALMNTIIISIAVFGMAFVTFFMSPELRKINKELKQEHDLLVGDLENEQDYSAMLEGRLKGKLVVKRGRRKLRKPKK